MSLSFPSSSITCGEDESHLLAHELEEILDVEEVGREDGLKDDFIALLLELLVKRVDGLHPPHRVSLTRHNGPCNEGIHGGM